jgi:hypothetical protein
MVSVMQFLPAIYGHRATGVHRMMRLRTIPLLLVAVSLAGCGGGGEDARLAIQGEVTFDGKPLPLGVIRFLPTSGGSHPMVQANIKEGQYSLPWNEGPQAGEHRVEIMAIAPVPESVANAPDSEVAMGEYIRKHGRPKPAVTIPPKYNRQSELTAKVAPDSDNTFNFQLEPGPQTAARK